MSKKKVITYLILLTILVGSILKGGFFEFIDFIIVRPIVNILFIIFNIIGDFGLAIIIFTILIKLLTWPLIKKQLAQTNLMKKLQPEIAKIRKNCNGNRQMESLQTMDLYKRHHFRPFLSFLTLLIQFPIFIALFSAINVIANPRPQDNLSNRAYSFVAYEGSNIADVITKQQVYLANPENNTYDFHPQLFGVINLEARAADTISSRISWSSVFMLFCAIGASVVQYIITKQQSPSKKKSKSFRQLMQEAKEGKELSQEDITSMSTGNMAKTMPIMMFLITFSLNGALAFYYFISNLLTLIQYQIINKTTKDDDIKDSTSSKFKNIQEAEIIENKKTGTKITHISAKDIKKKRR